MDAAWFAVLVLYVVQILHQKPGAYGCCWPWPRSAASRPAASGPGLPGVLGRGGLCCSPGWSWRPLRPCSGSPPA
jgi:hypothetical protein